MWGLHPFPAFYSSFVWSQQKPVGEVQPVSGVGCSVARDGLWPLSATLPGHSSSSAAFTPHSQTGRARVQPVLCFLGSWTFQRMSLLVNVNFFPKSRW